MTRLPTTTLTEKEYRVYVEEPPAKQTAKPDSARARQAGHEAIRNRMSGHTQTTTCGSQSPVEAAFYEQSGNGCGIQAAVFGPENRAPEGSREATNHI